MIKLGAARFVIKWPYFSEITKKTVLLESTVLRKQDKNALI